MLRLSSSNLKCNIKMALLHLHLIVIYPDHKSRATHCMAPTSLPERNTKMAAIRYRKRSIGCIVYDPSNRSHPKAM